MISYGRSHNYYQILMLFSLASIALVMLNLIQYFIVYSICSNKKQVRKVFYRFFWDIFHRFQIIMPKDKQIELEYKYTPITSLIIIKEFDSHSQIDYNQEFDHSMSLITQQHSMSLIT